MPKLSRPLFALAALFVAVLWPCNAPAQPQAYPSRPVTLIVSFEPGGSTDISARAVAQELALVLKQPVVAARLSGRGVLLASPSAPEAFRHRLATELEKWRRVARESVVSLE